MRDKEALKQYAAAHHANPEASGSNAARSAVKTAVKLAAASSNAASIGIDPPATSAVISTMAARPFVDPATAGLFDRQVLIIIGDLDFF